MRAFSYHYPRSTADAVALVADASGAKYIGGGTNLVDLMKSEVEAPALLVQCRGAVPAAIDVDGDGGIRLGASARNSDVAAHPVVRERYVVLSQAILSGASAQIRNVATVAGNVLQRTRCPYFTQPATRCNKREPGSGCSARSGNHRNHAILGASEACVATHPSDMAVALAALDAKVQVLGRDGARSVPFARLHRLPGDDPSSDTTLGRADLITAIDVSPLPGGARSAYRKVRDRSSFAFAVVSVAAVLEVRDGEISHVSLALGGVAHVPWRARRAESALLGGPATREAFEAAFDDELAQAEPLAQNAYKAPLLKQTACSVLSDLVAR